MRLGRRLVGGGIGAAVVLLGLGLLWLHPWAPDAAPVLPERIASSHFEDVLVEAPASTPVGLAAILSGAGGTGETERQLGAALRARGFIVLQLDLETWRKAIDRDTTPCIRPIVDIELLAKEAQRSLKGQNYLRPVLVGVGEGGTLTEAILSRTFAATLGGGVALDPAERLVTARPICDDKAPVADPLPSPEGGFTYPLPLRTQAQLTVLSAAQLPVSEASAPGAGPFVIDRHPEPEPRFRLGAAVNAVSAIAAQDAGPGGLPLVDLPALGKTRAVAVFFSGDGGWRDIDKTIGEHLTREGIHVVGIDALRYFWKDREPQTVAADIAAMLKDADSSRTLPVIVLGYSFGADLFPFSWPYLQASVRDRVRLIALLAPSRSTGFSVSVKGWLGFGGEHPVLPQLAALPLDRVLCVHGSKEHDSPCLDPSLAAARRLLIDGGHHFDGDYPALARRIIEEARLPR
ncbi:virulence factor family protein [Methylobacterium brachythecii]|uniref:Type IV secretory pathway VirJ component n=1 Tax=Methylobacterium brachythecii TaxID=1176177 RepID=A0A7W6F5Q7_9HYPH|nr:virulence factor family protein [Methylobacterium brachythecii]MBB3901549.1 type IV secretory pathway VirJ component [Methylobacterium brachythecii]GLS43119.1 virulence factor family protein [Methylobacterium brachythecii]